MQCLRINSTKNVSFKYELGNIINNVSLMVKDTLFNYAICEKNMFCYKCSNFIEYGQL